MTNEVLAKRIADLERQLSDERMKNMRLNQQLKTAHRLGWFACVDWMIENSKTELSTDGEAEIAKNVGAQYAETTNVKA